jgi:hypothetical protein
VASSHRLLVILSAGSLLACTGQRYAASVPTPATPQATVEQFLAAVNANDIERMAQLFGDERGPKADWNSSTERQQRLVIMQRLLQADSSRVGATEPDSSGVPSRRRIRVEVFRGERRLLVPFSVAVAQRAGGWLVCMIGLDALLPGATPRPRS